MILPPQRLALALSGLRTVAPGAGIARIARRLVERRGIRRAIELLMPDVVITLGPRRFGGRLETAAAPHTCAAFRRLLPFASQVIHVRWSGEAVWAPLGDLSIGVTPENATSYPHPGEVLWYPGGVSETELLIAYGRTHCASKAGSLAGNHFLTITEGLDQLSKVGTHVLWHGAVPLTIVAA